MWFRSWHGAPTDPKWLLIAKKAGVPPIVVSGIVWALFDYASQHEDRGCVEGFDVETYAVWSGIEEAEVEAVVTALAEKGMIVDGRLTAWEKRQPKREDDSKDRVRAHRQRKATEKPSNKEDVTPCNADVTHGNASEKIQSQRREETEAGARAPDGDAPTAECADIHDAELYAAECVREVRGASKITVVEVVLHLRECLNNRGSPMPEQILRFEMQKFRDHWQAKRANQPLNAKWIRWRQALSNWLARVNVPEESAPNGLDFYPSWDDYDDKSAIGTTFDRGGAGGLRLVPD